ncbi:replication protein [Oceanobacillus iheyensis]|uniref:replication protein n=1 Tax=Oceanobacillus iheyensis TaxID=182710 RepID=UPI0036285818
MASPQLEKGHTRIANEILNEIMKLNLNGTQFRLVLAIWRFTYGFQRKKWEMSISFLAKTINTSRSHVDRELKTLIDRNIIQVQDVTSKGRELSFNKNHQDWLEKDVEEGKEVKLTKQQKTKIATNKIPAAAKKKYDETNTYYKMAIYFYKMVERVVQDAGIPHLTKKANMQTWSDDMRKLVEIDEVDKKLVKDVMDWVVTDPFWKTNILSARKLRDKFPELAIKMKSQKQPKQKPVQSDYRDKEIALQQWIAEGNDPDDFHGNN